LGNNCILFKEFALDSRESKHYLGEEGKVKGNIYLVYNSGVNVEFKLWVSPNVKKPEDFIWMFFNYNQEGMWRTKSYNFDDE
jgi:hypothetical protein